MHGDFQSEIRSRPDDPNEVAAYADWLDDNGNPEYAQHIRSGYKVPDRLQGYDWAEAFGYAGDIEATTTSYQGGVNLTVGFPGCKAHTGLFGRRDVRRVIAAREGENDGDNWIAFGELWDGRFFAVRAGCDYTGWDCRASGAAEVVETEDDLMHYVVMADEKQLFEVIAE